MTAVLRPVVTQPRLLRKLRRKLAVFMETASVTRNTVWHIDNPRSPPRLVSGQPTSVSTTGPVAVGSLIFAYNNAGTKYLSVDQGITWEVVADGVPGGTASVCAQGNDLVSLVALTGAKFATDLRLSGASQIQSDRPPNINGTTIGPFSENAFLTIERNNASDPAEEGIWINRAGTRSQLLSLPGIGTANQIRISPDGVVYAAIGTALYRVSAGGVTLLPVTLLSSDFAVSDTEVMSITNASNTMRVSSLDGQRTANYTVGGRTFIGGTQVWNGQEFFAYSQSGDLIVYWDGVQFGETAANTGGMATPWIVCVDYP